MGTGGPPGRRAADVGPRHRPPARMKVAYYSPAAAVALGDRRLQRAAAPRARAADRRRARPARPLRRAPKADVAALPRRQRPGGARLDRRGAAPPPGRRRPARARAAPPRRRDHARPRRRGRLPRGDGARARPRRPPARLRRARQPHPAALGDEAAGLPARGRDPRLAQGLVVHSRYVEEGARAAGYEGPIARIPHPAWASARSRTRHGAATLIGCFGHLNESKRIPQLLRGVRAAAGAAARGAAAARRRRLATGSPISRCRDGRDPRGLRRRGAALVAHGRVRRDRLAALADDGRDLGHRRPRRSRPAARSSSPTSAGSRSCPTRSPSRWRRTSRRWRRSPPRSSGCWATTERAQR